MLFSGQTNRLQGQEKSYYFKTKSITIKVILIFRGQKPSTRIILFQSYCILFYTFQRPINVISCMK